MDPMAIVAFAITPFLILFACVGLLWLMEGDKR